PVGTGRSPIRDVAVKLEVAVIVDGRCRNRPSYSDRNEQGQSSDGCRSKAGEQRPYRPGNCVCLARTPQRPIPPVNPPLKGLVVPCQVRQLAGLLTNS